MHALFANGLSGRVTKWLVLLFWVVAMGVGATYGSQLSDVQDNQASSWVPATAESTRAMEALTPFYDPDSIPTVVAYERRSGLTGNDIDAARQHAQEFASMEGVEGPVAGPMVSRDGKAMQTVVTFNLGKDGWVKMPGIADDLRDIARIDGVRTYVTGSGGQAADGSEVFGGIDGTLLYSALAIVVLILLVSYRSPVLWVLPILSCVVALMVAQGLVYLLARHAGLTVNGQSQAILSILVIGAGTDYALLLVARYREQLRRHQDRHVAMASALRRAAPAILASAATVVTGMLCLLVAEMNSTAGLGPVAAVGVSVTLVVMLTLLPALLTITGRWVFWPKRPAHGSSEPTRTGLWRRMAERISTRPRRVWLVTAAVLALACLGTLRLDTAGLDSEDQYTTTMESIEGQQMLASHDLADVSNTVQVVAAADRAGPVARAMSVVPGVGDPAQPVVRDGVAFLEAPLYGDATDPVTFDMVSRVRAAVHAVPGADALVGGWSAMYLDTRIASEQDNKVIIPLVLLVVLLILMALLRAVVAPLILLATVVLSFGAALGLSTLLFEFAFGFEATDPSFPLFAFVFLVALGIDYNIFLMTRVREESARRGTRRGSVVALGSTGGVITSAGVVLASTFLVLGSIPVVSLTEIGVAVALGILLDTMVVRSVLVTAINLDLGRRIWWPSRLSASEPEPEAAGTPSRPMETVG